MLWPLAIIFSTSALKVASYLRRFSGLFLGCLVLQVKQVHFADLLDHLKMLMFGYIENILSLHGISG